MKAFVSDEIVFDPEVPGQVIACLRSAGPARLVPFKGSEPPSERARDVGRRSWLWGNGLALSDHVWAEQVKLDFPGDVGDAGLAGLAGGEVAGFPGLAGAGPLRAVADEGAGGEDLQQERGEREIGLLRGKKPRRVLCQ
jgi:hypothetical protein